MIGVFVGMILVKCEACGGNDLKRYGSTYICAYCGSKYLLDENDNIVDKELVETKVISLTEKARLLHEEKRYAEELDVLIEAVELDENNAGTMVSLGRCYRCLSYPDKAIECYKKAIQLNPNEGTSWTNMGVIHIWRENYKEAAECYEKGLPLIDKAEFDHWLAYANYAIVVAKLGDRKKAEKMIREAEARGYKNGEAVRKMAGLKQKSLFSKLFSR